MKNILVIVLSILFLNTLKAQNFSKIETTLLTEMDQSPESYFEIYIHLADRVVIGETLQEMRAGKLSNEERARHVVSTLRSKAEATQADILKSILRKKHLFVPESITPLWITNAIKLKAKKELIYEISTWNSVEMIYAPIEGETTIENKTAIVQSEARSVTQGIKAINAHALWKMGYTGYGRKAFVMDSGAEIDHPALKTQFAGNNIPFHQAWTGGGSEPFDVGGHGTHVTGTILGLDRKNRDTIGVAFNATWIGGPVQFSNSPRQPYVVLSFVENMQFALDPDGNPETVDDIPDVFNNSWGQTSFSQNFCNPSAFFSEAHLALEAAGVAMVWAAGNNGSGLMSITSYTNSNFDLVSSFAVGNVAQIAPFTIAESSSRGPSMCGGEGSLLIKPEVSAPGINVRSAFLNKGYAQLTGTSMAAPHVSGAVLLLKEAFPYLAGEEILMALYMTAVDLGEPGEDNNYGMGIIDVLAAYHFLRDKGHIPIPPLPASKDLILTDIDIAKRNICLGVNSFSIEFSNGGTDTIYSFTIDFGIEEIPESNQTLTWEGILLPGKSESLSVDSFNFTNAGVFNFHVHLSLPDDYADERELNNTQRKLIKVNSFDFLEIAADNVPCLGGEVHLRADNITHPGNSLEWYSDKNLSSLIGTGNQITIPSSTSDQIVYVLQFLNEKTGKTFSPDENLTFDELSRAGLMFNVYDDFILRSVNVYANSTGTILFQIINADNGVLLSRAVRLPKTGLNTIDLDLMIPEGLNYRINILNGRILGSSATNVNFPYGISDIVEIHSSYDELNFLYHDKYNYFFDWEISKLTCNETTFYVPVDKDKKAPELEILQSADTLLLSANESIEFGFSSSNSGTALWNFGNGQSSTDLNPFVNYTEEGTYKISLKMEFEPDCIVYAYTKLVVVDDRVTNIGQFSSTQDILIYPNPFDQTITISSDNTKEITFELVNTLGQTSLTGQTKLIKNQTFKIDTFSLPPGTYFLYLSEKHSKSIHKLFKF